MAKRSAVTEEQIRQAARQREASLTSRTCPMCERTFKPTRSWHTFDTDKCRKQWFRFRKALENAGKTEDER